MRIITEYLNWHFGTAIRELYQFWINIMWFGYHFFSMPLLFKTLIRPLYRIHESAPPGTGLNIELFFENLTVNLIARVVGFFLRLFLLTCGTLYQIACLIIAPFLFLLWIVSPFLAFGCIIAGTPILF